MSNFSLLKVILVFLKGAGIFLVLCKPKDTGERVKTRTLSSYITYTHTYPYKHIYNWTHKYRHTHIHTPQPGVTLFFIPHTLKACRVKEEAVCISRALLSFQTYRMSRKKSSHTMFVKGWLCFLFWQLTVHLLATTLLSETHP